MKNKINLNKLKNFMVHDFFWRCFKVVFYALFLELYYLLYFPSEFIYAPFSDSLALDGYKFILYFELILSFFYLFLVGGGILKYRNLEETHHKVWFWIFIIFIGLWFSTVWYKFGVAYVLGSYDGLYYRSPLQNLVSGCVLGFKTHYEPGFYLSLRSLVIIRSISISGEPLAVNQVVDCDGYVVGIKLLIYLNDHRAILNLYTTDSVVLYLKATQQLIYHQKFDIEFLSFFDAPFYFYYYIL